jgi:hypothetical protein
MKTYDIEVQRIKALKNGHGMVEAQIDAVVMPSPRGEEVGSSWLRLSEDNARVLVTLLKAQLLEVDKKKARSQR